MMTYCIYTRNMEHMTWDCMLSGFASSHEALTWLVSSYAANADFWTDIEVKVIRSEIRCFMVIND